MEASVFTLHLLLKYWSHVLFEEVIFQFCSKFMSSATLSKMAQNDDLKTAMKLPSDEEEVWS